MFGICEQDQVRVREAVDSSHIVVAQRGRMAQTRRLARGNWQLLGKFNGLLHPHLGSIHVPTRWG